MRDLSWEGCINVRDLGGLRARDGRETRSGRIVRADSLARLTAPGWQAVTAYGVRTVIDLRNDEERGPDRAPRPPAVRTVHLPLDATEAHKAAATPLAYGPHLRDFPERSAAVLEAIAHAAPGAVAVHCTGGRDRTGQITMLLLALCGVPAEAIARDYEVNLARLPDHEAVEALLSDHGATPAEVIAATLAGFEVESLLSGDDLGALRRRLLER